MFATVFEKSEMAIGSVCESTIKLVSYVVPSVGKFFEWRVDDLGPLVPEWSA